MKAAAFDYIRPDTLEAVLECHQSFIWWWHTDRPKQYWYFQCSGAGRL